MTEEEIKAQAAADAQAALDAKAAEDAKSGLDVDAANAELKKVRAEAAKHRTEKNAAEKREAAALARLKDIDDKDKTETERAQAALIESEAKLAEVNASLSQVNRTNKVLANGVRGEDADYVASKYAAASSAEGFDEGAFFATLKEAQPYLFGVVEAAKAPASGAPGAAGGAGAGGKKAEIEAAMRALEEKRLELRTGNRPGKLRLEHDLSGELYKLKTELRAL